MDHVGNIGGRGFSWRWLGWSVPVLLLLQPLIWNFPWTVSDYIVMGVLFGIVGLLLELAVRASSSLAYRCGAGIAVLAVFLLIWMNGAVGLLGDENNPANLMFFGVIAIAALGSVLARFQPVGMYRAMLMAAAAQALVGAIALLARLGSPGQAGQLEALAAAGVFGTLWLLAAVLFRNAAVTR